MSSKIIIIEDDEALRNNLKEALVLNGFDVSVVLDFRNVLSYFENNSYDLVILDINLPYLDGNYYCRMIRRNSNVPILITSARNSETDQILSMELGSDDYVVKPFNINVLISKINAILRRTMLSSKTKQLEYKGLKLDDDAFKLTYSNETIDLTKNEYRLVKLFITNPGVIIPREKLLEEIWDDKEFVDDNTLTVNVTRIKNKLEALGIKDSIKTKRGVGYLFEVAK